MVTFNCEVCNDTVPKKNTEKHYYRCPNAYYTCIDCSKTFDDGVSYQKHTQCISEDEKYQKALYKGKKQNKNNQQQPPQPKKQAEQAVEPVAKETKKEPKEKKASKEKSTKFELKKGESLYKIMKSMKDKDAKKELLKKLIVDESGNLTLRR